MITNYLALDIGQARIGLAVANSIAQIASEHGYITNDDAVMQSLARVIAKQQVTHIVVGLPRNLNGDDTEQTHYARLFAKKLADATALPVSFQDEALTSVKAEQELHGRGKPYTKGDIDSLSAVYILDDFLKEGVH